MIGAILFLRADGHIFFEKIYDQSISNTTAKRFFVHLYNKPTNTGDFNYYEENLMISVGCYKDYYILFAYKKECSPTYVWYTMRRLQDAIEAVFGANCYYENITNNIFRLHSLINHMFFLGYATCLDNNETKKTLLEKSSFNQATQGIFSRVVKYSGQSFKQKNNTQSQRPTSSIISSSVSWRDGNIMYDINRLYIDVYEELVTLNNQNNVLFTSITGIVKVTCKISGYPQIALAYKANDDTSVDPSSFSRYVDVNSWKTTKELVFIPPDGDFNLFSYRSLNPNVRFPFDLHSEFGKYPNFNFTVKLNALKEIKSNIHNIRLTIVFPPSKENLNARSTVGQIKINNDNQTIELHLDKFKSLRKIEEITGSYSASSKMCDKRQSACYQAVVNLQFTIHKWNFSRFSITKADVNNANKKVIKQIRYGGKIIKWESRYKLT